MTSAHFSAAKQQRGRGRAFDGEVYREVEVSEGHPEKPPNKEILEHYTVLARKPPDGDDGEGDKVQCGRHRGDDDDDEEGPGASIIARAGTESNAPEAGTLISDDAERGMIHKAFRPQIRIFFFLIFTCRKHDRDTGNCSPGAQYQHQAETSPYPPSLGSEEIISKSMSAVSGSDASAGSTLPSSISGVGDQPNLSSIGHINDTPADIKWPDQTDHDLIERRVAQGTQDGPKLAMAPLENFRFKGQPYDLIVGFLVKGVLHVWRLHREVVYPRCYAVKFHGKQDVRLQFLVARFVSETDNAVPSVGASIRSGVVSFQHRPGDDCGGNPEHLGASCVTLTPRFTLQDCLTCVKLGHWLNDTLLQAYERGMGAFLNERLTAWLSAYPAPPQGQQCSSDDVACVFARLASKPWYRDMLFGECLDDLRILLEKKRQLLLQDSAWARRVEEVPELGVLMGMDLIEL
ncbi:hypothetical protein EV126DRAFT_439524 [Verticillium dahliae]|nr:hypothetical protein EV126DRAFT_439524 [Verticillium dahliae]